MVVEAAVGAHRELSARSGVAYPRHRLTQEVCGPPSGVGAALAQARHQHVTRPGRNREQRVIAARTRVAGVRAPYITLWEAAFAQESVARGGAR